MQYHPEKIEKKWQQYWAEHKTFRAENNSTKPKYFVLDMFPYPSGAGLHVGHPLGYIASDIYARYKRLKGFNVLHPMGYDSFGLPAEQYAIQTGTHPAITTVKNIDTFRRQMDNIGFSFDWEREVRTSDPSYYKWTQWIFLQLFDAWYDNASDKARQISDLVAEFEKNGNKAVNAHCDETPSFSADEWSSWDEAKQQTILLNYRIAYLSEAYVNWCPALGTVLANDEVKDGVSERGGYPVERKLMKQWSMRITAYSQRLLDGLQHIDWSESLKEQQRNWIGRSEGASISFKVLQSDNQVGLDQGASSPPAKGEYPKGEGVMNSRELKTFRRELRKNLTPAEAKLWSSLKEKQLGGRKFRRQHSVGGYILDFYCPSEKLAIELDGEVHNQANVIDYDAERTLFIEQFGIKVLRFENKLVFEQPESVLGEIERNFGWHENHPVPAGHPSFSGGERHSDEAPTLNANQRTSSSPEKGRWPQAGGVIEVFTTRPDTIFGVSFMTLAPEHELVAEITTPEQKEEIEAYIKQAKVKSERERMADVKTVSGAFTGAYAVHPFSGEPIPIWIGDYVLAGYGTGAVMAVPSGDQRDWSFAKHFGIPIPAVIEGSNLEEEANESKDGILMNSDFLNGMKVKDAIRAAIAKLEEKGIGEGKINYRQRDAVFGRQRYWGEPIPVYYKDGVPYPINKLPLQLPEVEKYLPTEDGDPPLGNAENWNWNPETEEVVANGEGYPIELSTMPGWAGSSWYYLRYMDPTNDEAFVGQEALKYWENVDYYAGGAEHATGHLLYVRFWTKFLKDLGYLPFDEPAKKLVNQGMIQGRSNFVYRLHVVQNTIEPQYPVFISKKFRDEVGAAETAEMLIKLAEKGWNIQIDSDSTTVALTQQHVDVNIVNNDELDIEAFRNWRDEYKDAVFLLEDENGDLMIDHPVPPGHPSFSGGERHSDQSSDQGTSSPPEKGEYPPQAGEGVYKCGWEVEKMSKSKYNVVNPDDIIERYGADTLRLYEMFLGPLEDAKPWNTNGIEGVSRFLKKFWNLFHDEDSFFVSEEEPTKKELKALHATIKKVQEDIERLSFNTCVSQFMICVNELNDLKCNKRAILEPFTIVISTYAPHMAEEIWSLLGHTESITFAAYPALNESYLVEDSVNYPISFNGKTRLSLELPASMSKDEVEKVVLANEEVIQRLEGATPKKIIVVPRRIVNIVV